MTNTHELVSHEGLVKMRTALADAIAKTENTLENCDYFAKTRKLKAVWTYETGDLKREIPEIRICPRCKVKVGVFMDDDIAQCSVCNLLFRSLL